MKEIVESGMVFGKFLEENLFQIENSSLHLSFGKNVKTVEFILLQERDRILFVEAKSSCPNAENKDESSQKNEKFEAYYREITEKFIDSLQMFFFLGRNSYADAIGSNLKEKKHYEKTKFCFVLVIKNAENEEWLSGPKAELEARLKHMLKIWNAKILVLNETLAVQYGLLKNDRIIYSENGDINQL